ncbi:MAG: MBL fold metallo-hydrolase RNA specificity domain-containing protein, partial [Gemmatimonadales bacterium]
VSLLTISLTFWGAAGQVTGSCHLLEWDGRQVLLDCGMFQGNRAEARELNATLRFDPRQIDAVVVSHAHIDHIGRLPLLVAHQYDKPIFATPATRDLAASMLDDAAHIQESDFAYLKRKGRAAPESAPLYTMADAKGVAELMEAHPYQRPFVVAHDLTITYHDAGHIIGSANLDVQIGGSVSHRLVFSGDVGRWGQPIIRDPSGPRGAIDTLIVESTYALKNHGTAQDATGQLGEIVHRVAARQGIILIPSFALGRTQELIYALHQLADSGAIPQIRIYIDSPLAVEATDVFRMHPELFDTTEELVRSDSRIFDYHLVTYVRDVESSKRLNTLAGPAIIIAASGMAENGRITHHLANHCDDPRNCILLVGYQAQGTLGRRIQEGKTDVRILGEPHHIGCEVATIDGYSAHAGRDELRRWVRELGGPIQRGFCVHGEPDSLQAMAKILTEEGVREVHVPKLGERFEIA